jgi:hypothetical protein
MQHARIQAWAQRNVIQPCFSGFGILAAMSMDAWRSAGLLQLQWHVMFGCKSSMYSDIMQNQTFKM